jgi:hypothetical protein
MRMGLTRLDGSLSHNQRSCAMIGQEQPPGQTARAPFLVTLNQHVVNRGGHCEGGGKRRPGAMISIKSLSAARENSADPHIFNHKTEFTKRTRPRRERGAYFTKLSDKALNGNSSLCHSDVMEEIMPASWKLSLGLGLSLVVPAAAFAAPPSHHHYRPAYHGTVVNRAAPGAPALASVPNFGFWPGSYKTSHEQYKVEGLTRDTDGCAKYGCLGAN